MGLKNGRIRDLSKKIRRRNDSPSRKSFSWVPVSAWWVCSKNSKEISWVIEYEADWKNTRLIARVLYSGVLLIIFDSYLEAHKVQ